MKGQVALVTGGSGHLGAAICQRLASEGAHVVVHYNRGAEAAERVVADIAAAGGSAGSIQANVTDADEIEQMVKAIHQEHEKIDILVNNAGITRDTLFVRMTETDWDAVMETNLKSAFLCSKAVVRNMLRARYGRIINVSSIGGFIGAPGQANYSASKAGLWGLTRSLAREVATRNVTANCVAPGYFGGPMTENIPEDLVETILKIIPIGRYGEPHELAATVAFLASEDASYITGQILIIDGGIMMY
jgi:3-oxoacyl-[acyl-carrier protein] reductase